MPVIFSGLGVLLSVAFRWLIAAAGVFLVKFILSALFKKVFAASVGLVAIYTTMYNVDAANAFLAWLADKAPDLLDNVTINGAGSLVQALRLDDVLTIILMAYGQGWLARLMFKSLPGTSPNYADD